ncbi:TonB family protein [Piscinibacter sp. XHJ-5]|uniref:energy transducer TonB n=1 Tax=Piscinibacter sp. XHJ-5 TaxID=3037797 RepID=UPI0024536490|nr:TonB family protein [Piscinibacter sp. XHJ-5]
MSHRQPRGHRAGRVPQFLRPAVVVALAAVFGAAHAQTAAPASSGASDAAPSERAKRDAEKVFQWIRIHSDKPRKAVVAVPERPAPAPPVKRALKAPDSAVAESVLPPPPAASATRAAAPAAPPVAIPPPPPQASTLAAVAQPVASVPAPAPAIEEDEVLTAVYRTDPEFPGSLMRSLRKGTVQVSLTVQPDGSVSQPRVVSATHPRLGQTAVATVAQWRFQPLRHAQQAVVDLGFNLD